MNFFNLHLLSACPVPGAETLKAAVVSSLYHPLKLILFLQRKHVPLSFHFAGLL